MARRGKDLLPRRRRPRGEDRISALSDDLLLLVLRRLDTRSALGMALLSKRWAHLPRELPALEFRVRDSLPPPYQQWVLLHHDIYKEGDHIWYKRRAMMSELIPNIRRYERRAMRGLTGSVESFLGADDDGAIRGARWSVSRLRVEFFITHNTGCMNRLITRAIDAWGVDELEAVAKPIYWQRNIHAFPSHGLCEKPGASGLRSLKLSGCVLPPLHEFTALTELVLQDLPESTTAAAYEGVFASCRKLQVLHLNSCGCSGEMTVVVDAPSSEIRELVVDRCAFRWILLRALPCLESIASLDTRVFFESTSFPGLRWWNFTLSLGVRLEGFRQYGAQHLELELFLGNIPDITDLIIRLTGPDRWIVPPSSSPSLLPVLRRLLVADVPLSWDVSWPRLLEMAPSLEILHIHIGPCTEKPGDEISWRRTKLRQHPLKEFVVAGFGGTKRQIYLVKFIMGLCKALCYAALFKNGRPEYKGKWDWEMVMQPGSWTDEEKNMTLKKILHGSSSLAAPVQLVFS